MNFGLNEEKGYSTIKDASNKEELALGTAELAEAIAEKKLDELLTRWEMEQDQGIKEQRGKYSMTSTEAKFINDFKNEISETFRTAEPSRAALKDVNLPVETIDLVFRGITQDHPLLSNVTFQRVGAATEWVFGKNEYQKAAWGDITAATTQEANGSFDVKRLYTKAVTAYIAVPNGLIDLGPSYLFEFVVDVLQEMIANGLEYGIVNSVATETGPIGMMADISKPGEASGNNVTYTAKAKETVTSLDPKTYGGLIAKLAVSHSGIARPVNKVLFICNPVDYWKVIHPATTQLTALGIYQTGVVSAPTEFIQSAALEEGTAILGLPDSYVVSIADGTQNGVIQYSDDFKFLDNVRTFKARLYASGLPLDENSFLTLDISGLEPVIPTVKTVTDPGE